MESEYSQVYNRAQAVLETGHEFLVYTDAEYRHELQPQRVDFIRQVTQNQLSVLLQTQAGWVQTENHSKPSLIDLLFRPGQLAAVKTYYLACPQTLPIPFVPEAYTQDYQTSHYFSYLETDSKVTLQHLAAIAVNREPLTRWPSKNTLAIARVGMSQVYNSKGQFGGRFVQNVDGDLLDLRYSLPGNMCLAPADTITTAFISVTAFLKRWGWNMELERRFPTFTRSLIFHQCNEGKVAVYERKVGN